MINVTAGRERRALERLRATGLLPGNKGVLNLWMKAPGRLAAVTSCGKY